MTTPGELVDAYQKLDHDRRNRNGRLFVSDWFSEHPYVDAVLPPAVRHGLTGDDALAYYFHNDRSEIHRQIQAFHAARGEPAVRPESVFIASGMTPLITAQMILLRRRGLRRVFHVRPLYYSYYYLAESLGIELVPVNEHPIVDSTEQPRLPDEPGSWLIMCDPVWFMGRSVDTRLLDLVRDWQSATGGMVIVDGAFQYLRWSDNRRPESASRLLADQAMVNRCPTKAAAVHGPRFAYSIVPPSLKGALQDCYANVVGAGSAFDRIAGESIMRWLNLATSNDDLLRLVRARHAVMTRYGLLGDRIRPTASYFCFASLPLDAALVLGMDQRFFDTSCLPGMVRFNLLLPQAELIRYVRLAAAVQGYDADHVLGEVLYPDA